MSQAELIRISKKVGMESIIAAIKLIQSGNFQLIPNPENEKTYFPFPTKKDVKEFYQAGKKFY
jgi:methionyl-tRNA formyltransferase